MKRISVFEELKRLRQELEHEKKLRKEWQNKYYMLEKELKEVKALLNQFLNANTPSSKLPPQFKPTFNQRPEKALIQEASQKAQTAPQKNSRIGLTGDLKQKSIRNVKGVEES